MTREEFLEFLVEAQTTENTKIFALNCFDSGRRSERENLAAKIEKLPFGDTSASFAAWIREQT